MQDQYYMISGDRIVKFGMALVMAEMCSFVTTLLFQGDQGYIFINKESLDNAQRITSWHRWAIQGRHRTTAKARCFVSIVVIERWSRSRIKGFGGPKLNNTAVFNEQRHGKTRFRFTILRSPTFHSSVLTWDPKAQIVLEHWQRNTYRHKPTFRCACRLKLRKAWMAFGLHSRVEVY